MTNDIQCHIENVQDLSAVEMVQTQGGAAYLKFDGVDGETEDSAHGTGGGGGAGKCSFQDVSFVAKI